MSVVFEKCLELINSEPYGIFLKFDGRHLREQAFLGGNEIITGMIHTGEDDVDNQKRGSIAIQKWKQNETCENKSERSERTMETQLWIENNTQSKRE